KVIGITICYMHTSIEKTIIYSGQTKICELRKKIVKDEVKKTKLRQELKARTNKLEKTILYYSIKISKLNIIIVKLKNKTVMIKLKSENIELRDRIRKVEQRQILSNNISK
ncbi:5973_t:CDS:2, partial [Racocetra persica]